MYLVWIIIIDLYFGFVFYFLDHLQEDNNGYNQQETADSHQEKNHAKRKENSDIRR